MSSGQLDLSEFGSGTSEDEGTDITDRGVTWTDGRESKEDDPAERDEKSPIPKLGFKERPEQPNLPDAIADARSLDWVATTGRYPFMFDAARVGFAIGHRENESYQWRPDEVTLPVHFLDNNYEDPDLDRFVERVYQYEPNVAVLGDIYTVDDLPKHLDAADEIWDRYPDMEIILVPKCEDVLDEIPEEFVLGYPNGKSDILGRDVVNDRRWRTLPHRLHILGGSPLSQLKVIKSLTEPWVTGEPPADIAGVDWNGFDRFGSWGDYAKSTGGWHDNLRDQYRPKREIMLFSYLNAKHFWVKHGIWPGTSVSELPLRDELLSALSHESEHPEKGTDMWELFIAPGGTQAEPVYRTDETHAEIIEPVGPVASLDTGSGPSGRLSWEPAGAFSDTTTCRPPETHSIEPHCTGCGAHVLVEPHACNGAREARMSKDTQITVEVVSYEQQKQVHPNHYESLPEEGPDELKTDQLYPNLHIYCSSNCRQRVEGRNPRLLLKGNKKSEGLAPGEWPEGETVAQMDLSL